MAAQLLSKQDAREFRAGFETLMLRKFFYVPSFEIYGGVGGLYDFGPPGCALKANLLELWKQHFVLKEQMLQVDCSALTPEIVLKTSGHVDKFTDFMVRDDVTGVCHRADKILEDHIDATIEAGKITEDKEAELLAVRTKADAYSQEELAAVLTQYGVKAPDTGNAITAPFPFNLMFATSIGPTGKSVGYMRPETAQGIFVNFRRLLEYNGGCMPFAAAQIGMAFRNEISPRSGLLRVREFQMAEIEHFVNPNNKKHKNFEDVADMELNLLSQADQTGEDISRKVVVRDAVAQGTVDNETLAYFMARTHLFLVAAGVQEDRLRFRQHKVTEMAHYAKDCWDAEIHTSYGWIECVGHADRAAFDLESHSAKSKVDLSAQEAYDVPIVVESYKAKPNQAKLGPTFRKDAPAVVALLKALEEDQEAIVEFNAKLQQGPVMLGGFEITADLVTIVQTTEKSSVETYIPSVIEPSFGIGRIMYALLEHSYETSTKAGEEVRKLALKPCIAPVKCAILPLGSKPEMLQLAETLRRSLVKLGLETKTDPSGASIGRKYARADEIGVPFAMTIDFESLTEHSVTIRERDGHAQIRVPVKDAAWVVGELISGECTWAQACAKHPTVDT